MERDAPAEEINGSHPEEMKASGRVRLGPLVIEGRARATPASLIAAAIVVSAAFVPIMLISRQLRRR